jgi:hypothetical protein
VEADWEICQVLAAWHFMLQAMLPGKDNFARMEMIKRFFSIGLK